MRLLTLLALLTTSLFAAPTVQVKLATSPSPIDGRLIVVFSKKMEGEPRFQVGWDVGKRKMLGIDGKGWKTGDNAKFEESGPGNPLHSLSDLPAGTYNVQAVLNVYDTFHRADGHTVKLHMDHGEGQQWNRSPGNLYSKPQRVGLGANTVVSIDLTETMPAIALPADTKFLRHVSIESKLLTHFWGRSMRIAAIVLLPNGFEEHPQQKYPVAFMQGHFAGDFFAFRETPQPNANAYRFYQDWTSGRLPKMLLVVTQHPTPYYDDSYGVNTANMGPYGDALTTELYPEIERRFRGIGEAWSRVVFGGSTGGWMTLAQQVFYPDYFGGAWGFCPDPVDFHAFQTINVYSDKNAYYDEGPFLRYPKLLGRRPDDHILATMEQFSVQESVLGTRGRSGGQMDAFHATFGPTDSEGYPAKLWDTKTGEMDPAAAKYWREHYDLTAILARDSASLRPKLQAKIPVTMSTQDTFYLDAAPHRMDSS